MKTYKQLMKERNKKVFYPSDKMIIVLVNIVMFFVGCIIGIFYVLITGV